MPALSEGFLKQVSQPLGFGSFAGALGEGQHLAAFTDPAAAQETATAQKGGDILSQVLGSHGAREEIALRASSATGISPGILSQMLPVIASMIFGGLTKSLQNQGFGGIFGQLSNAAGQGGLGQILGQILGGVRLPRTRNRLPRRVRLAGRGASEVFWVPSWEISAAARARARARDPRPLALLKCRVSTRPRSRRASRLSPKCCSPERRRRRPRGKTGSRPKSMTS